MCIAKLRMKFSASQSPFLEMVILKKPELIITGMIDRQPVCLARVADVVTCLNFAHAHGLLLSFCGYGHNAGRLGIASDAVMVDLGYL